ncbi:chemotaxis protein CheC [Alkalimonas amylolytica]|uniref:Chemotaxis protein CheC n=1 Tax=Alkalimonas amylolytica TaxID=152573 RepID=A0A1H3ZHB8_ALKAM|nr:chemotaxis protein CheC [Alkalimonas amylolytica]SEA23176.1 chemotaxis protein CheC [Alkalimonas amylolytica]
MSTVQISDDQKDALQEILNISMGQAANSLARLISCKITLSIPQISQTTPHEFSQLFEQGETMHYTRQSFLGDLKGEMLCLMDKSGCDAFAEAMDYSNPPSATELQELILDVSNVLAGACLLGMSKQLTLRNTLNPPMLFDPTLTDFSNLKWQSALLMEVDFVVERANFSSRVIICLEESSISELIDRIDKLLE